MYNLITSLFTELFIYVRMTYETLYYIRIIKCGTDLPYVVGFGEDPGVCLVDGHDQKQGDCASVHFLFGYLS